MSREVHEKKTNETAKREKSEIWGVIALKEESNPFIPKQRQRLGS